VRSYLEEAANLLYKISDNNEFRYRDRPEHADTLNECRERIAKRFMELAVIEKSQQLPESIVGLLLDRIREGEK
jgi:hypothetical protein